MNRSLCHVDKSILAVHRINDLIIRPLMTVRNRENVKKGYWWHSSFFFSQKYGNRMDFIFRVMYKLNAPELFFRLFSPHRHRRHFFLFSGIFRHTAFSANGSVKIKRSIDDEIGCIDSIPVHAK